MEHPKVVLAALILTAGTGCGGGGGDAPGSGGSGGGGSSTSSSDAAHSTSTGAMTDVCQWKACGGDPIGSWTYSNACFEVSKSPGSCAGSYVGFRTYLTGTLDLHADGTALVDNTLVQETYVYYPKACWAPNATQCEDFVQGDGLTCMNTATDCLCTTTSTQPNGASTDTFTVNDGHVVFSDGTDFTFCADASHLLLIHDTGERTYLDATE